MATDEPIPEREAEVDRVARHSVRPRAKGGRAEDRPRHQHIGSIGLAGSPLACRARVDVTRYRTPGAPSEPRYSDFKRNTVDLLSRIRKTGNPMVLTINGKAEIVVQDAEAYQALLDRVETLEGILRGVADVNAGRAKPAQQVFGRLRRKHGIPR